MGRKPADVWVSAGSVCPHADASTPNLGGYGVSVFLPMAETSVAVWRAGKTRGAGRPRSIHCRACGVDHNLAKYSLS